MIMRATCFVRVFATTLVVAAGATSAAHPDEVASQDLLRALPRDIVDEQDVLSFTDQVMNAVSRADEDDRRSLLTAFEEILGRSGFAASPSGVEAKNRIAVRWLRLGEDAEAERLLKDAKASATRASAASIDTQRLLGQQYMFRGEFTLAAQEFIQGREQFDRIDNPVEKSVAFQNYLDVSGKLAEVYAMQGRGRDAFDLRAELLRDHLERLPEDYKRSFRMHNAEALAAWGRLDEAFAEAEISQGELPHLWPPEERFNFEVSLLASVRPPLSVAELVERYETLLARPVASEPETASQVLSLRARLARDYRLLGRDGEALEQANILLKDSEPLLKSSELTADDRGRIESARRFAQDMLKWYDKTGE
jgi:tetratricopeptide (TPR) repeat protein